MIFSCQEGNICLNTYATDYITAEANADMINYKQSQDINAIEYLQQLWTKSVHYMNGTNYNELSLRPYILQVDQSWVDTVQKKRALIWN